MGAWGQSPHKKLKLRTRNHMHFPLFTSSCEFVDKRDLMRTSGGSKEFGYGEIVTVTYAELFYFITCQECNSIPPFFLVENRNTTIPEAEHKGIPVPVKSKIHLIYYTLMSVKVCN